jgi:quercetin dioxygenase-like cupin family protein
MTFNVFAATLAAIVLASATAGAQMANPGAGQVHEIFHQPLPEKPGMDVVVITVSYPPGASTPAHEHPGFVFAYVLKGAVTSALGNGQAKTYSQGQFWSEQPFEHHTISKNASNTAEAEFLVFFVVPHGAKLVLPIGSHG